MQLRQTLGFSALNITFRSRTNMEICQWMKILWGSMDSLGLHVCASLIIRPKNIPMLFDVIGQRSAPTTVHKKPSANRICPPFHDKINKNLKEYQKDLLIAHQQYGNWQNTRIVYGTRVLYDYTRLSLGLESISLNVRRTWKQCCSKWKQCWRKTMYK